MYIPSGLAYGPRGRSGSIKPDAILIFEVEVADVITEAQAKIEEEAAMKKQEADQRRMIDSMSKAQKLRDTTVRK